ncbi:hypothetical protein, partial [Streptomyces sp. DH12]|uniref:hypothetical protein n=1 Tax=Streptomyces sp. DH12 TaxID=2857010 RepID=UPI001E4A2E46
MELLPPFRGRRGLLVVEGLAAPARPTEVRTRRRRSEGPWRVAPAGVGGATGVTSPAPEAADPE